MADKAPEEMSAAELKAELTRMRVRSSHCIEKSELLNLLKTELANPSSAIPNPAAAAPKPAAQRAPAPKPAPPSSAAAGGGTYVNGRYVPPPKGPFDEINWQTVGMVVLGLAWLYSAFNGGLGGGGMSGLGDDEGEYNEGDTSSYIAGKVVEVTTHQQFLGALAHHRDHTGLPVVVDFFSHSCGPCRQIAPEYKRMAKEFKGKAVFLKVDVNRNYETSSAAGIRAMPTFNFFWLGKKKHEFSGADSRQLRQITSQMASQAERAGTYVGVEVTSKALADFYEKHGEAEKVEEAPAVAKKFRLKVCKLLRGLRDKYEDVPELAPEGSEAEEAKQQKKQEREARRAARKDTGSDTAAEPPAKGQGHGESAAKSSLADWKLSELQLEIDKRVGSQQGDNEDEDEDEEPNYWLDPDAAAALDAASLATPETLLIIGGGPAGLSASIYAARAGLKPLIVAPAFGGQLLGKGVDVENYPGVSGASATGRGVVGLMRAQAASFDTRMVNDAVIGVDLPPTGVIGPQRVFTVRVNGTRTDGQDAPPAPYAIRARAVVVATGADSRWLGVPGEHDFRGKGVSSCATCDGFLYREKTVVVIGGGDTAMEDALVLARTSSVVKLVHRRDSFRASKVLADRVLENPKIEVVWNAVVERFEGSEEAGMTAVAIKDVKTGAASTVAAAAAFVAIGHVPNTGFVSGLGLPRDDQGYITRTDGGSTHTAVEGVFVCGDASDKVYRQAVTSAGSGAMAALDAERWLSEQH